MLFGGPFLEYGCELMVGDNDMFGDFRNGIDVIEDTAQNGVLTNLEQRFWEVLRKFA